MKREELKELVAQRDAIDARLRPILDRHALEIRIARTLDILESPSARHACWVEIAVNTGGAREVVQFRTAEDPVARALFTRFLFGYLETLKARWTE